ncbi:MAG: sprT domain-containing protein [Flavobacteriaceae bacterium]|jgi:hypothetical protein|nr:sprT domain-containing protein [Pelagibacterales bacterium]MBT4959048.1 sprT domain-containing protein [Flavobacteriaceae bacterium]MBT6170808.1 sprT domain-containing protein [Flavobacteriaceae bacterium]MBT6448939.1 sprT domain-containing protein [Flavobacteriaceae bacterium]MBT7624362.1 sprT domain-containing protein [Flavobacteriaceae bacterium]
MKNNEVLDYIPVNSFDYVKKIISEDNLVLKVVKERKTKHGDFRKLKNGSNQITLNYNKNQFRFLITLIHELAHFRVSNNTNKTVRPHGIEWKKTFKKMMLPLLNNKIFPDELLSKLAKHLKNPSASSDSDIDLVISLNKYDLDNGENCFLFDVLNDSFFEYRGAKIYKKINKLRKRYICEEIKTGKKYLFSPVSRVKKINYEKSSG